MTAIWPVLGAAPAAMSNPDAIHVDPTRWVGDYFVPGCVGNRRKVRKHLEAIGLLSHDSALGAVDDHESIVAVPVDTDRESRQSGMDRAVVAVWRDADHDAIEPVAVPDPAAVPPG